MGPPMKYGCCVCKRQLKGKLNKGVSKKLKKELEEKDIEINEKIMFNYMIKIRVSVNVNSFVSLKRTQKIYSIWYIHIQL